MKRHAFSVVELMVVVAILGMLSAAVFLSLRGPLRRARFHTDLHQIEEFDARGRSIASSGQPASMIFRTADNSIELITISGAHMHTFAGNDRLVDVIGGVASAADGSARVIDFGAAGVSPSYAVRLRYAGETSRWLAVMGLSGETYRYTQEQWDEKAIGSFLTGGNDAR